MTSLCRWLHEKLERRPLVTYPFDLNELPLNGIYFFYENSEVWGHSGERPRIVRVGTHKSNNFRSRINEHFLLDDRWMNFTSIKPAPKDRSIFRKNLGRVIVNSEFPEYLKIWNISFIKSKNKEAYSHLRNVCLEKNIERKITELLRENFSFRHLEIEVEEERIGSTGLESRLIGTLSRCQICNPSRNWFGLHSPKKKIRDSGLWQVQHLSSPPITLQDQAIIESIVDKT